MAKKKEQRTTFSVSMSQELLNEVQRLAADESRKVSQMCAVLLKEAIAARKEASHV